MKKIGQRGEGGARPKFDYVARPLTGISFVWKENVSYSFPWNTF